MVICFDRRLPLLFSISGDCICSQCRLRVISFARRYLSLSYTWRQNIPISKNYYETLGLKKNASGKQVKEAYFELSKVFCTQIFFLKQFISKPRGTILTRIQRIKSRLLKFSRRYVDGNEGWAKKRLLIKFK